MKKYYVFLVLTTLLFSIGCSNSDDSTDTDPTPSNNDRSISFYGAAAVEIDTVQGQFIKDYQVSSTIEGSFSATNFDTGQTILVFLYDDDENSFPFTNNGSFPINSDPIRATARYTEFGGIDLQATSGSITVSEYRRIEEPSRTLIEVSGTFDVSNDTDNVFGAFNNIRVQCLQCD